MQLAARMLLVGPASLATPRALQRLQLRAFSEKTPSWLDNLWGSKDNPGGAAGEGNDGPAGGGGSEAAGKGKAGVPVKDSSERALVVSSPGGQYRKVNVVELGRKPLFPGIYTPVMIKNEKLIKEIMEIKKQGAQAYVGAFLKKTELSCDGAGKDAFPPLDVHLEGGGTGSTGEKGETPQPTASLTKDNIASDHLHEIGTFAQVHTILMGDSENSAQLLLLGHRRIRRTSVVSADPLAVYVTNLKDEAYTNDDYLKATSMEVVNTMRDLLHLNPLYGEQFRTLLQLTGSIDLQDISRLVDAAASLTSANEETLQGVLEQLVVPERAQAVLLLLKKEVELCKLQADIREQVESKIMKEQRRMLLMEQLKSIKRELGLEKDDKSALVQRFSERWEAKKGGASEEVQKVVADELEKLGGLEPVSPEFNITRNYLEWLTSLPWGIYSPDIFDLAHAQKVLDEDHFGLDDVKERIMEFIAVSGLRGSAQGKILCLVGPPGVGKTSIARSVARTLHRKYYRFSVGGLHDVAEIKGHRRTYVGAMPGKVVQCLKAIATSNPLLLIDEIDKLGRGHTGDPASALLELLDPEQNSGFADHYLDVPVDMSKALFMCTANVLDTIPGPLLDRMEVIRLSGYTADEKVSIARRYLEPQACADSGVPEGAARLTDEAMETLINDYCREAGVRNLKKHLEKIYRKVALKIFKVTGPPPQTAPPSPTDSASGSEAGDAASPVAGSSGGGTESKAAEKGKTDAGSMHGEQKASPLKVVWTGEQIVVDKAQLKDYVGQAVFAKDKFYETTPPGVVMGLAWTSMGGATLYIEAAHVRDSEAKGALTTTGQLGDVFRESATIAHTYARTFMSNLDPSNKFFATSALHVHVPQGATPKDGPSAGCTITTALLSLATGRPVRPHLAMTGEVTLTGCVLPIGGVKEKVLAARRASVQQIIFPEGNRADYEELHDDLKTGLSPHFVSHYDQVFKLAIEHDTPFVPASPVTSTLASIPVDHSSETSLQRH